MLEFDNILELLSVIILHIFGSNGIIIPLS